MSADRQERDPQVERLLAPLRAERPAFDPRRREAVWQAVAAQRRPRPWIWPLALTAAAAAALALFTLRPAEPEVATPAPTGATAPPPVLPAGQPLAGRTVLPGGARVDSSGEVHVASATDDLTRLVVTRGAVESTVPPLGPGQRYEVETALAEVAVRGTRFTVEHEAGATVVTVTEGRVEVRPRDPRRAPTLLGPGERRRLEPLTAAGAEAALQADDAAQAAAIWEVLADRADDELARRNLLLRAGRALDRAGAAAAADFWRAQAARFPEGAHADELAFRAAAALRRAGRQEEAAQAAADFRARFPDSPRLPEAAGW